MDNNRIRILYGKHKFCDATNFILGNNINFIPPLNDCDRFNIFKIDPNVGVVKDIVIIRNGIIEVYGENKGIDIDIQNVTSVQKCLDTIHSNIKFSHGNLREEYPEQLLTATYLNSSSKVLELGSNVGRNTVVIASVLEDQANLVTMESDPNTVRLLIENRDNNKFKFNIEASALSKRNLIQRGWETIPSDVILEGYSPVNSISFKELETKYSIRFDTLVADCEGALYYILQDDPDMLKGINTVIMENDYTNINHKNYVDEVLKTYGLSVFHQEGGGWGPCSDFFYEVWVRI